jgi:hypothetical protein
MPLLECAVQGGKAAPAGHKNTQSLTSIIHKKRLIQKKKGREGMPSFLSHPFIKHRLTHTYTHTILA